MIDFKCPSVKGNCILVLLSFIKKQLFAGSVLPNIAVALNPNDLNNGVLDQRQVGIIVVYFCFRKLLVEIIITN